MLRGLFLLLLLSLMCLTSAFRCASNRLGCTGIIPVDHVCCGDRIVPSYQCCESTIMKDSQVCCGGGTVADLKTQVCCNGSVFSSQTTDCCDGTTPSPAGTCSDKTPVPMKET